MGSGPYWFYLTLRNTLTTRLCPLYVVIFG
jgi:hypothetical protein